jgi:hypothetical protein
MTSLLSWRWGPGGRFGIGAAFGIWLSVVMVVLIAWDLSRGPHGGHRPPQWYGGSDFVPARQEVCPGVEIAKVQQHMAVWESLCWPAWPEPERVDASRCDGRVAPAGVVRWHTCDEPRVGGGKLTPPCTDSAGHPRRGATWATLDEEELVSADVYVQLGTERCVYAHEGGHARGILDPVNGESHTTLSRSLMSERCPDEYSTVWLDRCDGGDWPW